MGGLLSVTQCCSYKKYVDEGRGDFLTSSSNLITLLDFTLACDFWHRSAPISINVFREPIPTMETNFRNRLNNPVIWHRLVWIDSLLTLANNYFRYASFMKASYKRSIQWMKRYTSYESKREDFCQLLGIGTSIWNYESISRRIKGKECENTWINFFMKFKVTLRKLSLLCLVWSIRFIQGQNLHLIWHL